MGDRGRRCAENARSQRKCAYLLLKLRNLAPNWCSHVLRVLVGARCAPLCSKWREGVWGRVEQKHASWVATAKPAVARAQACDKTRSSLDRGWRESLLPFMPEVRKCIEQQKNSCRV